VTSKFSGLPSDLFTFLSDLSKNNNREWFTANKERYRTSVMAPISDFICAMAPRLNKISEHYVADPRPHGGSMFRIYRDARFSKDKRPYKENVGCHFRHAAGKDAHAPGFYLHIEPNNVFFGVGIWQPPHSVLDLIRTAIVEQPEQWKKIITNKTIKSRFEAVKGDGLKKAPRGYDPHHIYIEDLKRKTYFLTQSVDQSLALTPKFITEVERAFKAGNPLAAFITKAMSLPY